MKKSIFFISFDEAQQICDKSQYCEASLWEKIKLNFRYIWCKYTRKYVKRNQKLTEFIEKSDMECLTPKELYELKRQFEHELESQN